MAARVLPRPAGRVVAAIAAVAVAAAMAAGSVLAADASPGLPERSAEQLLVDVQRASVDGLSGTVVQTSDLGFPALPSGGGQGSADLSSLITGTHTLRVWFAGPEKVRLALLGSLGESDVIRNGSDVWVWSSTKNEAMHTTLNSEAAKRPGVSGAPSALPMTVPSTPEEAARLALAALGTTTTVTTTGTAKVAGRDAYQLVLAPKDESSLIGSVRIGIDGEFKVPLKVEVFAKGAGEPAFEVGFTRISFTTPADDRFSFAPPPGATVREGSAESIPQRVPDMQKAEPTIVGTGWTAVAVVRGVSQPSAEESAEQGNQLSRLLANLPTVSGTWGSGQLLESRLFTALITTDGRLLVGAVSPQRLYEVAGTTR